MNELQIVGSGWIRYPAKGHSIGDGTCEYFKTEKAWPAFKFRWQGAVFAGNHDVFVFPKNAEGVRVLDDQSVKKAARTAASKAARDKFGGSGLLLSFGLGWLAGRSSTSVQFKGIQVAYKNEEGNLGTFVAVGPPKVIDEIVASIPPDKFH